MITVCPIDPMSKDYRRLIDHSHQHSIYLLPEWLALHDVAIYAAYRGTDIIGGIIVAPTTYPLPYVPYQGLLLRRKEDHETGDALLAEAEEIGRPLSVWNAPSMYDIRDFTWRWWSDHTMWSPNIRYTYFNTPDSEPEPRCRALITDKPVVEEEKFEWFDRWKEQEWVGPVDAEVMEKILGLSTVKVWTDYEAWVVWGVDLKDRGYYLASIGKPTNVIYHLIQQHSSTDMCGANSPERAKFKRSFGGILRNYYGMVAV